MGPASRGRSEVDFMFCGLVEVVYPCTASCTAPMFGGLNGISFGTMSQVYDY